jgi:hypothetical protein
LKLAIVGLCFGFACLVSLVTWYYVVGEAEAGVKAPGLDVTIDEGKLPSVKPIGEECLVEKTATEWYSPGAIKATSEVYSIIYCCVEAIGLHTLGLLHGRLGLTGRAVCFVAGPEPSADIPVAD